MRLVIILLLLSSIALASDGFRLEVGHFALTGGPLTVSSFDDVPIPDGCLGQVIEDVGGDGIASPLATGVPAAGDRLIGCKREAECGSFAVNGAARLGATGAFLTDIELSGAGYPSNPIYLRVWNAPDPASATAYWDSPLYRVMSTFQQVSFDRAQWSCHGIEKAPSAEPTTSELASADDCDHGPLTHNVLLLYPNPFNAAAQVSFLLERSSLVQLDVYDLLGRRVQTVLAGHLSAGSHQTFFDGRHLPSGPYLLSLRAGDRMVATRRVLLVR